MRVLVYPHDLGMGGSQLNAIEIAAATRDLGHEVVVFGRPGALVERVRELGLEFIEAPQPGKRPSPTVSRALAALIDERGFDVLHGYEWPPALECVIASRLRPSAVAVSTVMSMSVPPFIPRSMPLIVGTEEIAAAERESGRRRIDVIEPPVDLSFNGPDVLIDGVPIDVAAFRGTHGLDPDRLAVVAIARFAHELKLEGTLTAIDAIGELSTRFPVQLVLVGDGPARDEVHARADAVNARFGAGTVVLTGQLSDPRPAYAAADITLGMGGSALRALSFGKPLVVQGEQGFWELLTPDTLDQFLWTGWYGIGSGPAAGPAAFEEAIVGVLADAGLRADLGRFGREVIESRFSLTRAAGIQVDLYEKALAARAPRTETTTGDVAALARYASYYVRKRIRRARGTERSDDFNAKPVRSADRPVTAPPVRS